MKAFLSALLLAAVGLAVSPAWADEAELAAPRASVEASLLQRGERNRASVHQVGALAAAAVIYQQGDMNTLSLSQSGAGNFAQLSQVGASNTLDLAQRGDANAAVLAQVGAGLALSIAQNGGASITITQRGP